MSGTTFKPSAPACHWTGNMKTTWLVNDTALPIGKVHFSGTQAYLK